MTEYPSSIIFNISISIPCSHSIITLSLIKFALQFSLSKSTIDLAYLIVVFLLILFLNHCGLDDVFVTITINMASVIIFYHFQDMYKQNVICLFYTEHFLSLHCSLQKFRQYGLNFTCAMAVQNLA